MLRGAEAVIPTQKNRKEQRGIDPHWYRERNVCERFWSKAKQYRRRGDALREEGGQLPGVREGGRDHNRVEVTRTSQVHYLDVHTA